MCGGPAAKRSSTINTLLARNNEPNCPRLFIADNTCLLAEKNVSVRARSQRTGASRRRLCRNFLHVLSRYSYTAFNWHILINFISSANTHARTHDIIVRDYNKKKR